MISILDPMAVGSNLSIIDLNLLMFSQRILSRDHLGNKVNARRVILDVILHLLETLGEILFNKIVVFGFLLTNSLKQALPSWEIHCSSVNLRTIRGVEFIDMADNLNGSKDILIMKKTGIQNKLN